MAGLVNGKIVLVTGGGSGIGRATSLALVREGAKVMIADYNAKGGEETVKMIKEKGGVASFMHADVSVTKQVEAMIQKTVETYGRIDGAHNNAGIEGRTADTADCTEEVFDRTIAINLKAVWLCMKYEIPQMLKQGGGAIVNTASIAGLCGFNGLPAYVASKHGVVGLTRTAALEYARRNIRVNCVCPGVINTPMVERLIDSSPEYGKTELEAMEPVGRMGKPEEIAEGVVWLMSDAASFVTGHPMVIDGGWVAR